MGQHDPTWSSLVQHGPTWSNMVYHGPHLFKSIQNHPKFKTVKKCLKLSKRIQHDTKGFNMVQNCPKLIFFHFFLPNWSSTTRTFGLVFEGLHPSASLPVCQSASLPPLLHGKYSFDHKNSYKISTPYKTRRCRPR